MGINKVCQIIKLIKSANFVLPKFNSLCVGAAEIDLFSWSPETLITFQIYVLSSMITHTTMRNSTPFQFFGSITVVHNIALSFRTPSHGILFLTRIFESYGHTRLSQRLRVSAAILSKNQIVVQELLTAAQALPYPSLRSQRSVRLIMDRACKFTKRSWFLRVGSSQGDEDVARLCS